MPMTRKLISLGENSVVTIPRSWIKYAENQKHRKIVAVAMEVNGSITISPIFEEAKT